VKILLVGMNHRTAPVEVRERFAVDDPRPWLAKLVESPEVDEAVLISTCNRVEVIAAAPNLDAGRHRLRSFFHRELGQAASLPQGRSENAVLYEHVDGDAVRHLFRVAASIDSLVVGEPQILGQVKEAYRVAAEGGTCGPLLNRLFASAFAASKRVRNETEIASRPVSMARVAVDLARQIFETLEDKRALLVGAGEMIEMALEALRGAGLAGVAVANRTPERAGELAVRFGASAHGLDELPALLATSDIVLTSIGADRPLLDVALFEDALRARRRQPIFAIDLGVPRNIDPAVNQLDDVYLYDVDDLGGVAESNAEERRRETVLAEAIVQQEVERWSGWLSALQAVPTIRRLRSRAESIRQSEVDKAIAKLGLDETQQRGVEALTRAVVNKVLHAPVSRLREQAEREGGLAYLEAAKVLFALDDPSAPGAESDLHASDVPNDDESAS
jgi:glutamyl-tRNA reductase